LELRPAALSFDQTPLCEPKNGDHLFSGDSGVPVQEIVNRRAILQILEQQRDWHMSALEPPHTSGLAGSALHYRAFAPVKHSGNDKPTKEEYKG